MRGEPLPSCHAPLGPSGGDVVLTSSRPLGSGGNEEPPDTPPHGILRRPLISLLLLGNPIRKWCAG